MDKLLQIKAIVEDRLVFSKPRLVLSPLVDELREFLLTPEIFERAKERGFITLYEIAHNYYNNKDSTLEDVETAISANYNLTENLFSIIAERGTKWTDKDQEKCEQEYNCFFDVGDEIDYSCTIDFENGGINLFSCNIAQKKLDRNKFETQSGNQFVVKNTIGNNLFEITSDGAHFYGATFEVGPYDLLDKIESLETEKTQQKQRVTDLEKELAKLNGNYLHLTKELSMTQKELEERKQNLWQKLKKRWQK